MGKSHNAILIGIMKNEGPYILEWIAHNLALGFDKIMVFSADCDDLTDRMLDRLAEMRLITHCPNPKRIFKQLGVWHVAALRYATLFNQFTDSDWVMAVDVDEFLEVAPGDHTLGALFEAAPRFDLMSFTVVGHNSSDIKHIGDGTVQDVFRRPQMPLETLNDPATRKRAAVKTLMSNPIDGALFRNHRPKIDDFSSRDMVWLNGGGAEMPAEFTDKKVNLWQAGGSLGLAQVNHHSLRSMESFMVKVDRGDAVNEQKLGLDDARIDSVFAYWKERNAGTDVPERVPMKPKPYATIHADLHRDTLLHEMHEEAISIHEGKVARMLTTPGGEKLARMIGYLD